MSLFVLSPKIEDVTGQSTKRPSTLNFIFEWIIQKKNFLSKVRIFKFAVFKAPEIPTFIFVILLVLEVPK
jgi:hypothetical protein